MHDHVKETTARKITRTLGVGLDAIAPPGTARGAAIQLAGRAMKALPRLASRRYLAHKVKMTMIRAAARSCSAFALI